MISIKMIQIPLMKMISFKMVKQLKTIDKYQIKKWKILNQEVKYNNKVQWTQIKLRRVKIRNLFNLMIKEIKLFHLIKEEEKYHKFLIMLIT